MHHSWYLLQGFDVVESFSYFLYPLLEFYEGDDPINENDDDMHAGCMCGQPQCICFNDSIQLENRAS